MFLMVAHNEARQADPFSVALHFTTNGRLLAAL